VCSMFDVPPAEKSRLEWHGRLPIEEQPWHVGLIVGPSGSGKTTILRRVFGAPTTFEWSAPSVIDDFDKRYDLQAITDICQAVGFNTIPAWLRPYSVLSNGEQFRVDLARRLLDGSALVTCDEFTSVVDRQVATIGAHAVQKFIRRHDRRFVAASCHYDLEDWLQPDCVLDPATMQFRWRSVQRRPELKCTIHRAPYQAWDTFARFHYLTTSLARGARCFVLLVDGNPASFAALLNRPHPTTSDIWGITRGVTLPDYQGLGLIFALMDRLAAALKALGKRCHGYPAHPSFTRSWNRSPIWRMTKKPGYTSHPLNRSTLRTSTVAKHAALGGRPWR
jgi:GNAT superfamily N-acetyltransferase